MEYTGLVYPRGRRSLWSPGWLRLFTRLGRLVRIGAEVPLDRRKERPPAFSDQADVFHNVARRVVTAHGITVHLSGALPEGPCVVVANHLGYLDPFVIGGIAPMIPIAKAEIADWPVIGPRARAIGVRFVKRDCPWSGARIIREGVRILTSGQKVLGFPEGTTTDGTSLHPFRRGLFGMARIAGVPVVPIRVDLDPSLTWTGDDLLLPHYMVLARRERMQAVIRILPATRPAAYDYAWSHALSVRAALGHARGEIPSLGPARPG